jgi:hypothetical protein
MEQEQKEQQECQIHENKIRRFDYWRFGGRNDRGDEAWDKSPYPQSIQTFCADCGKILKRVKIWK